MAFGNGGGWGYPPYGTGMPEAMMQMRMRQQGAPWQQNRPLYAVMVDGEQAARDYFVPPGEKAIMFDKEHSVFYIKEVNEYNSASFEAFKYDPIPSGENEKSEYVTRAELDEILSRMTGGAPEPAQQENPQREQTTAQRRRRMAMEGMNDEQPGV